MSRAIVGLFLIGGALVVAAALLGVLSLVYAVLWGFVIWPVFFEGWLGPLPPLAALGIGIAHTTRLWFSTFSSSLVETSKAAREASLK